MKAPTFVHSTGFRRLMTRYIYPATQLAARKTRPAGTLSAPHVRSFGSSARWYTTTAHAVSKASSSATAPVVLGGLSIAQVEDVLHHKFKDRSLLAQAMTHRSVVNSGSNRVPVMYEDEDGRLLEIHNNNERLELLGDRVFGLLVVEALYHHDVAFSEGEMSIMAHSLLSRERAHGFCETLGLDKLLLQSEMLRGQKGSRYGDMFEALLGALFVDGGYDAAMKFFQLQVVPAWDVDELQRTKVLCKKQELQEYLVRQGLPAMAMGTQLKYIQIKADHIKQSFTQGIELFGRRVSVASGKTRGGADQAAAEQLLSALKRAKTTCFLIRLARNAGDKESLAKLQATRAAQMRDNENENKFTPIAASRQGQR